MRLIIGFVNFLFQLTIFIIPLPLMCCNQLDDNNRKEEINEISIVSSITIDWSVKKQIVVANGINFAGYHSNGGQEILSETFRDMLKLLPCQLNRVSLPLKVWEPENENNDCYNIDLSKFFDIAGVHNTFLRIKELKQQGMDTWLSIWDMANWNIKNSENSSQRRISCIDELAESIASFIIYGKEKYNVEPLYISVNEPTIAIENGWGGYNIALSAKEQIELIQKAGRLFEKHNLKTKWLVALHKIYPSEMEQAKQIFADNEVKRYVAGFDFHGYNMQTSDKESYLMAWKEWVKTTGLITFCGECDYDNKYWEKEERKYWGEAPKKYGTLIYKMLNMAGVNGFMPWYNNVPSAEFPYRYVSKHFMEAVLPGTQIVESDAQNSNILVTAGINGTNRIVILQNLSDEPVYIEFESDAKSWNCISSENLKYFIQQPNLKADEGKLMLKLPANSLHTLTSIN